MTTKDYLNQIREMDMLINNKIAEVTRLKEIAYSVKAVRYDKEYVQATPNIDKIGTAIAKIDEVNRTIDKMIDAYVDKKDEIVKQIDKMQKDVYYDVLYKRYVLFKPNYVIAEEINYSERHVSRLHDTALDMFEEMFGMCYLNI